MVRARPESMRERPGGTTGNKHNSVEKGAGIMYRMAALPVMALLSLLAGATSAGRADNAATPGEVTTPYPTITNLAVEWVIAGDDNLNCVVNLDYRMAGAEKWLKGMPLIRVPSDDTGQFTHPTFRWDNKLSGSILDLRPNTEYEIRLQLSDPDGGKGEKIVRARTRPVPRPAVDAPVKKVNPNTFEDSVLTARPGDILLLTPGYYGDFSLLRDGEPGRPIVIRADGSHPVINSTFDEVSLQQRKHVILEGVTVNGSVNLRFAEDVAVRHCKVNARYGIIAKESPGCKNCYIADNTITSTIPWVNASIGSGSIWGGAANVGEGVEITGPGNVVCFNRVSGYRDCMSFMEDLWVYDQICIDFYNNDIAVGPDDGIEADFAMNNCRIMRNRITNCGMGLSSQPGLGGPTYFIRNVMYNIAMSAFKLERYSVGNIFLHNTAVKAGDGFSEQHGQGSYFRTVFENNLCLGGTGGGRQGRYSNGTGMAVFLPGFNNTCVFDYNGVGSWKMPFSGMIGNRKFADLAGLRTLTGGSHSVKVDLNTFKEGLAFPDPVYPERQPADLRLRPGSPAVDAGVVIPGVNDNFTGKAPDLGAYELGQETPHYGPRPKGVDEATQWVPRRR